MNTLKESVVGICIIGILLLIFSPSQILMPMSTLAMLLLGLVVFFLLFFSMVWKEHAADERELLHIQKTGRLSFLAGASILLVGVIFQAIKHEIDPWLLFGLIGMIFVKFVSRLYHSLRN